MLKFRHIDTQATLNTVKFSADSTNTTYFLYSLPSSQVQGTPDVNYEDICFVKPTGQVYTHGKLYGNEAVSVVTDSTITENSTNPVQSSAIFTALAKKVNNGGGVATAKKLTQSEYNALSEKDENTVYVVTDGDSLVDQIPLATTSANGLMSAEDKKAFSNPIQYFYNANTSCNVSGNREKAIQHVVEELIPNRIDSGVSKFAVIRHSDGFAFCCWISQYLDYCFIIEFGYNTGDLITYGTTLTNGNWGTVSKVKSF